MVTAQPLRPWRYSKDSFVHLDKVCVCVLQRYAHSWTCEGNLAAAVTFIPAPSLDYTCQVEESPILMSSFQHSFPYAPTHSSLSSAF